MARSSDAFEILQSLYRFTQAQDRLDLATMAAILAPNRKIKFDLTRHFPDVGVLEGAAAEMCNILYEASANWTATQHPVFNPVVTFDPENESKVKVEAMVQALHSLEREGKVDTLIVYATWIVAMEKLGEKWAITGMEMVRDVPIADPMLFQEAQGGKRREPSSRVEV